MAEIIFLAGLALTILACSAAIMIVSYYSPKKKRK